MVSKYLPLDLTLSSAPPVPHTLAVLPGALGAAATAARGAAGLHPAGSGRPERSSHRPAGSAARLARARWPACLPSGPPPGQFCRPLALLPGAGALGADLKGVLEPPSVYLLWLK